MAIASQRKALSLVYKCGSGGSRFAYRPKTVALRLPRRDRGEGAVTKRRKKSVKAKTARLWTKESVANAFLRLPRAPTIHALQQAEDVAILLVDYDAAAQIRDLIDSLRLTGAK